MDKKLEIINTEDIVDVDYEEALKLLGLPQDHKLSAKQKIIVEALVRAGVNLDSMVVDMIESSNKAITINAKGDIIPDHKSRFKMKKELLEMGGIIDSKTPEIKINFFNKLFGLNDN